MIWEGLTLPLFLGSEGAVNDVLEQYALFKERDITKLSDIIR